LSLLTHLKLLTRLPDNHVLSKRQLTLNALQSSLLTQNTTQWLPLNGFRLGVGLGSERDCIRLCKFWDWQMVNFLSINPCRLDFRIAGGRIQRKFEFIST
jgi:hypothetical protein